METRSGRLDFTPHSGPHTVALRLGFDRPVLSVAIALPATKRATAPRTITSGS